jgi:16S rRNA (cytosine967-C5)-methyltransferase
MPGPAGQHPPTRCCRPSPGLHTHAAGARRRLPRGRRHRASGDRAELDERAHPGPGRRPGAAARHCRQQLAARVAHPGAPHLSAARSPTLLQRRSAPSVQCRLRVRARTVCVGQSAACIPPALARRPVPTWSRWSCSFDHPADAVVARFFRDHQRAGAQRERGHTRAQTAYATCCGKQAAVRPPGPRPAAAPRPERRLAILGIRRATRDFLGGRPQRPGEGLAPRNATRSGRPHIIAGAPPPQPAGLAGRRGSRTQAGDQISGRWRPAWAHPRTLDLRVNALQGPPRPTCPAGADRGRRHAQRPPTPYSPWGLARSHGKPAADARIAGLSRNGDFESPGRGLAAAGPAARRPPRRDGGRLLRRRRRQDPGPGGLRCAAPGACMPSTPPPTGSTRSSPAWRAAACPMSIRSPSAHERDDRIKRLAGKSGPRAGRRAVLRPRDACGAIPDLKWRQGSWPRSPQLATTQAAILHKRGPAAQAGRSAGLCHLQPPAAGERAGRRGLPGGPPGLRDVARGRHFGRIEGRSGQGPVP